MEVINKDEEMMAAHQILREKLRKIGGQDNLNALARTTYQELKLSDFKHFEGKIVNVVWNLKQPDLDKFGCADWENMEVLSIYRAGCGEIMARLKNYPMPVRVERLKENI